MKLVLISDSFPPVRNSGAVQLRDLGRELVRQGHDITVLVPSADIEQRWKLENVDGVQVLRLRSPKIRGVGQIRRGIGEILMPRRMYRNLRRCLPADQRWDGIVWYSPSIFHGHLVRKLKKQSGCKGYLIIRDIFPEWAVDVGLLRRGLAYRFFKLIARQQYSVADAIGVQSPGNLRYFEPWLKASKGRSLEVLQNWLDKPFSVRSPIRIEETPLVGRRILVYAGNMGIAQGMDIFLDLAEKMKFRQDIGFLFVGRGDRSKDLRDLAVNRDLDNVLFFDEIDPDEIQDLYSQCDVGIVALDPRHKSHNIPGKFLSYLQGGLPVLANINAGNDLADLIRNEHVGEVCESNKLSELEQRCISLIDRLDEDQTLSSRCVRLFERQFSVAQAAQQVVRALH